MPCQESASTLMKHAERWGLISPCEAAAVDRLFASCFPFAEQLARAESIHIHVKVDDTDKLPQEEFLAVGGELDHEKEGFVKFRFDGGINLIFSSIAVSQDELIEDGGSQRCRPFVDHFGIDLRAETPDVERSFADIPAAAEKIGWGHVPQGGPDRGVHCCHVEVKQKHWVYPRGTEPAIPLEFAFGQLKMNPVSGGCDLRPMDPERERIVGKPNACSTG